LFVICGKAGVLFELNSSIACFIYGVYSCCDIIAGRFGGFILLLFVWDLYARYPDDVGLLIIRDWLYAYRSYVFFMNFYLIC